MQKIAMLVLVGALPAGAVCAEVLSSSDYGYRDAGIIQSGLGEGQLSNIDALLANKLTEAVSVKEVASIRGDWLADEDASLTIALCLKKPLTDVQLQSIPGISFFAKSQSFAAPRFIYRYQTAAEVAGFSFSSLPGLDASCSSIRMGELFSYFSDFGHCPDVVSYEQDSLLLTLSSGLNQTVSGVYSCDGGGAGTSGGGGGCCSWLWSCLGGGQSGRSQDVAEGGGGGPGAGGGDGGGDKDRPVDYSRDQPSDATSLRDQLIETIKKILRSSEEFKEYRFNKLVNTLTKPPYNLTPDAEVISWAAGLSEVADARIQSADSHQQWRTVIEIASAHINDPMTALHQQLAGVGSHQMHLNSELTQIAVGTVKQFNQPSSKKVQGEPEE